VPLSKALKGCLYLRVVRQVVTDGSGSSVDRAPGYYPEERHLMPSWIQADYPSWRPSLTKDSKQGRFLLVSGMTDTVHVMRDHTYIALAWFLLCINAHFHKKRRL